MPVSEVGYVISTKGFLVQLDGLPTARINDIIEDESGVRGLIHTLYEDRVEALILDDAQVVPGQLFRRSEKRLALEVGQFLLGRAINPLGVPVDGHGPLESDQVDRELLELDRQASGISSRQFITDQLVTGFTLIDTLIPLGKGQRELIIGDAHSGKTAFLTDLVINQKNSEVVCIYALIGKPLIQVRNLIDILDTNDALDHTVVISAASSDPAPMIFLAPQTAFTVAEFFQKKGKDVLVILDDLGNHAKVYREIALLGGKAPGRESYPGDIFYQHAHLIERAGNFKRDLGGGSITALPVIELNLNDFTTFIPTNLMAMTDGHLLFKANLHNQGQTPAVDIGLSVSRVGRQTQNRVQNLLSQRIRQVLAQAAELETVSRFSSELPYETQLLLRQKSLIEEIIKQQSFTSIPLQIQAIMLALPFTSFLREQSVDFVHQNKPLLIRAFQSDPQLIPLAESALTLQSDEELIATLEKVTPKLKQVCST